MIKTKYFTKLQNILFHEKVNDSIEKHLYKKDVLKYSFFLYE